MLKEIAKDDFGKIIISIVLGLGIAALFRKVCNDRNCIVVKGPPIKEIEGHVFSFDNSCYKYKAKGTSCNKNDTSNSDNKI